MNDNRTRAWILLSLADEPSLLTDIIGVADALEHRLPERNELQDALGWLMANGFVTRQEQAYAYSDSGLQLRNEAKNANRSTSGALDDVENALSQIEQPRVEKESISQELYDESVKAYREWFAQTYRMLTGKDPD